MPICLIFPSNYDDYKRTQQELIEAGEEPEQPDFSTGRGLLGLLFGK